MSPFQGFLGHKILAKIHVLHVLMRKSHEKLFGFKLAFKGSVSSNIPCTHRLVVCLCCRHFMAHENGDKQRPARRRHVQGMLEETDPESKRPRLPFTSFKMRQWLFLWNFSNRKTYFWDIRLHQNNANPFQEGEYVEAVVAIPANRN